MREKKATEELRRKLDERREKRKIEQKLAQVRTVVQTATTEDDDTVSWVEKSRRLQKQKEDAAKRAKMLEEMDEAFGVGDMVTTELMKQKAKAYTSKDLRGLKVEHDRVSLTGSLSSSCFEPCIHDLFSNIRITYWREKMLY